MLVDGETMTGFAVFDAAAGLFDFGHHGVGFEVAAEVFAELVLGVGVEPGPELEVEPAAAPQCHPGDSPQILSSGVLQSMNEEAAV